MAEDSGALDEEAFYKRLLLEETRKLENVQLDRLEFVPTPCHVLKTRNSDEEKVFINVCTSDKIPAPKDISEEELAEILNSDDAMRYRVPLSLGEPHAEVDKSGKGCTAYDVVVSPAFYEKTQNSAYFQRFFTTVVFEGLESKYDMSLDRNVSVLKNKKNVGTIQTHSVRTKSKPVIMEMDGDDEQTSAVHPKLPITEQANNRQKKKAAESPKYTLIKEPPEGQPEFLVLEISLPGVKSVKSIALDVGEDRLVVHVDPDRFHLDLDLPANVNNETCGAQFNKKLKILTVTLPVLKKS